MDMSKRDYFAESIEKEVSSKLFNKLIDEIEELDFKYQSLRSILSAKTDEKDITSYTNLITECYTNERKRDYYSLRLNKLVVKGALNYYRTILRESHKFFGTLIEYENTNYYIAGLNYPKFDFRTDRIYFDKMAKFFYSNITIGLIKADNENGDLPKKYKGIYCYNKHLYKGEIFSCLIVKQSNKKIRDRLLAYLKETSIQKDFSYNYYFEHQKILPKNNR